MHIRCNVRSGQANIITDFTEYRRRMKVTFLDRIITIIQSRFTKRQFVQFFFYKSLTILIKYFFSSKNLIETDLGQLINNSL